MSFTSIDPSSGELVARYDEHDPAQVEQALAGAWSAFTELRAMSATERGVPMAALAQALRANRDRLALLATREMGKPVAEARAEVDKCAWVCDFYATNAEHFLAAEPVATEHTRSEVHFSPLGVVLGVMPWNYPYWQVLRAAAPIVMAGNSVLLKHAPNVTGCALALQELFEAAGFPAGTLRVVLVHPPLDSLIADHRIRGVTLTGSERAGTAVATAAGAHLKKCVLELGGSDAFVVAEDADVEAAARMGVRARFQNTGQSCIAAKRFLVVDAVADRFEESFVEQVRALSVGDPSVEGTDLGPMARRDLRDTLVRQVRESVAGGARLRSGGDVPDGPGAFLEPVVLTDVGPGMPVFTEETFGPVAALTRVPTFEAAIELANESRYGLSCAVWIGDVERATRAAARFESGGLFVNSMTASDPRLPFGGIKRSGYGRELGAFGIREFTNIQTVVVA